jgi:hypothetical protein
LPCILIFLSCPPFCFSSCFVVFPLFPYIFLSYFLFTFSIFDRVSVLVVRSWLRKQRSRVRFPALADFLRSSGSGTGSTQLREDN